MSTFTGQLPDKKRLFKSPFLSYFITPTPPIPLEKLTQILVCYSPNFVCYRNLNGTTPSQIRPFLEKVKELNSSPILHYRNWVPALLPFIDGIHLPSIADPQLVDRFHFYNKIVIASTHTLEEVKKFKNADFITFSPIFDSKGRKGVGVEVLEEVAQLHPRVIGLGGITSLEKLQLLQQSPAIGFASIRYFLR